MGKHSFQNKLLGLSLPDGRPLNSIVMLVDLIKEEGDMKAKGIPNDVKQKAEDIIVEFNRKTFPESDCFYEVRFRGKHLYLDRCDYGNMGPICRLTYTGNMEKWEFAIFRWSREKYDPDEWLFPGSQYIDGTIEGAMKAGLEAYPA